MGHTASLSQLQHPRVASVDGKITPYEDVRIHASAEALTRALSVFEGLKAYWDDESDGLALRWPDRHYARLDRTARCSTFRCTSRSTSTSRGSTSSPGTSRRATGTSGSAPRCTSPRVTGARERVRSS